MSLPAVILNMTADEESGCDGASKRDKMSMIISLKHMNILFSYTQPVSSIVALFPLPEKGLWGSG